MLHIDRGMNYLVTDIFAGETPSFGDVNSEKEVGHLSKVYLTNTKKGKKRRKTA